MSGAKSTESNRTSYCRLCGSACGITVTINEGSPIKVIGDPEHPISQGFTCLKGRALPELHNSPSRLLTSLKRCTDGSFEPIRFADAVEDVASRLSAILDKHGPRSVALYSGTAMARSATNSAVGAAFWEAIRSPMRFNTATIDQPGKMVATSLHGRWGGGVQPLARADVWVLIGTNPVVSKWAGAGTTSPAASIRSYKRRGMKLVVIDPRRTETATLADVHLRPKPGQDAVLLAGIVRCILDGGLQDDAFCARDVAGLEDLRIAVDPFTPSVVESRAGVPAESVVEVARIIGMARTGVIGSGTGVNFSANGDLSEYLTLCIHSIRGFWRRVGEPIVNPGILLRSHTMKAQAEPQSPAWGYGEPSRVRGLSMTDLGMPTATLADEILLDGPGQVRALFCVGGNPVAAWPNQLKVIKAMEKLELLVCFDPEVTATARFADYVIAPKLTLETPALTVSNDHYMGVSANAFGFQVPFAMYAPAVAEPPIGSEVVQEFEFYYALARTMGLTLSVGGSIWPGEGDPTDDWIFEQIIAGAAVTLDELKSHEHGAVFADRVGEVEPPDEDRPDDVRLNVGHKSMMKQLRALSLPAVSVGVSSSRSEDAFPFALISRRVRNLQNSYGQGVSHGNRAPVHNPAHIHPTDAAALGVRTGDLVEIASALTSIRGIIEVADDVLAGTVSMAHCYGAGPEHDADARMMGSPTNRLVNDEVDFDPYTGIPIMSGIPVRIRKLD